MTSREGWTKLRAPTRSGVQPSLKASKPSGLSRFLHFGALLVSSDDATDDLPVRTWSNFLPQRDHVSNHPDLSVRQPVQLAPKLATQAKDVC